MSSTIGEADLSENSVSGHGPVRKRRRNVKEMPVGTRPRSAEKARNRRFWALGDRSFTPIAPPLRVKLSQLAPPFRGRGGVDGYLEGCVREPETSRNRRTQFSRANNARSERTGGWPTGRMGPTATAFGPEAVRSLTLGGCRVARFRGSLHRGAAWQTAYHAGARSRCVTRRLRLDWPVKTTLGADSRIRPPAIHTAASRPSARAVES